MTLIDYINVDKKKIKVFYVDCFLKDGPFLEWEQEDLYFTGTFKEYADEKYDFLINDVTENFFHDFIWNAPVYEKDGLLFLDNEFIDNLLMLVKLDRYFTQVIDDFKGLFN